jgi:hypothetical protein
MDPYPYEQGEFGDHILYDNENNDEVENNNAEEELEYDQITDNRIIQKDKNKIQNFICIICHTILVNPKKCKICKHHFCNKCILKWLQEKNKCPHCLGEAEFEKPEFYLKTDLDELLVNCKNIDQGCNEVRKITTIFEHDLACDYIKKNCPYCQKLLISKELVEHVKQCNESLNTWKMYDYFSSKISNIEKDFNKDYQQLKDNFCTWLRRKEFKLKQLQAYDNIQKTILSELNKFEGKKETKTESDINNFL